MKNFVLLLGICVIACCADTIIAPRPESAQTISKTTQAIIHIDEMTIPYEDVTDEGITSAILQTAELYDLSDDELQAVVDHYAD